MTATAHKVFTPVMHYFVAENDKARQQRFTFPGLCLCRGVCQPAETCKCGHRTLLNEAAGAPAPAITAACLGYHRVGPVWGLLASSKMLKPAHFRSTAGPGRPLQQPVASRHHAGT